MSLAASTGGSTEGCVIHENDASFHLELSHSMHVAWHTASVGNKRPCRVEESSVASEIQHLEGCQR